MHLVQYWQLGMFGCTTYILSANTAQPNPGIRPIAIGVGEVLRRITGKSVSWSFKADVYIYQAAGPLLTCASHGAGAEAAIRGMRELFEDGEAEAVLLPLMRSIA